MTNKEINLAKLSFTVGQISEDFDMSCRDIEELINYANSFTVWEENNILSLPNGWEDYTVNGGDDYEFLIYQWAQKFVNEKLK